MGQERGIYVSVDNLRMIADVLTPEETAVYIAGKAYIQRYDKVPSINNLKDILGTRAVTIVKKLKDKGVLPKGRLDFEHMTDVIAGRKKILEVDGDLRAQAKVLTYILKKELQQRGVTPDNLWFSKQIIQGVSALRDYTFSEIKQAIKDSFAHPWWGTRTTSLSTVRANIVRFQLEKSNEAPVCEHSDVIEEVEHA